MVKRLCMVIMLGFGVVMLHGSSGYAEDKILASYERYELDNGLVVIIEEDHRLPVLSIQTWHRGGSAQEQEYIGTGISHLVEHMLFKGTHSRDVGSIGKEVKALGGSIGGYTTLDRTVYTLELPSASAMKGLELMTDVILNSSFHAEEFEKEREVIYKEIKLTMDSPGKFLFRKLFEVTFTDHPYRFPVIGFRDRLASLDVEGVYEFYKKTYVPNNLVMVIVGDVDPIEVLEKIRDLYKDTPRGEPLIPTHVPERPLLGQKEERFEKDVAKVRVLLGWMGPSIRHKDLFRVDTLASILGDGKTSRLYRVVKEEKQLVYAIDAFSYTPREQGVFGVSFTVEPQKVEEAKAAILDEIKKIKRELVKTEELDRVKAQTISSYIFHMESVGGRAGYLGMNEVMVGDPGFSKTYLKGMRLVQAEDVQEAARKYLELENMIDVRIYPKGMEEEKRNNLEASEWSTHVEKFDNGLTLVIQVDRALPIVSVNAVFLGGQRAETVEKMGISNFMASMLLKGTKKHDQFEIAEVIENRGGSLSAYGGNNSFGLRMKVISEYLEESFDVFADVLLNADFPEPEIEKTRLVILASLEEQEKDIYSMGSILLNQNLYKGHPYGFRDSGSKESVLGIRRGDLRDFYRRLTRPDNMVLTVYGDVEKEEIVNLVKNSFKNWRAQDNNSIDIKPELPKTLDKVLKETYSLDKEQTLLLIGFPGVDIYSEDKFVFEVTNEILTGQGGRLFERIRGEASLAYSVGSFYQIGLDPGSFVFYVFTVSSQVDQAREKIFEEIALMQNELIGEEELSMAKNKLVGQNLRGKQSLGSRAFDAALNELYGLGYDYDLGYEERIRNVTAGDIQKAAKKYWIQDRYVNIVAGNLGDNERTGNDDDE
ncbi:insulinase family protein [PVC group bacterium]|nr:insulinase family protein [PVC group bacterium]